jgi:hypothetical protein
MENEKWKIENPPIPMLRNRIYIILRRLTTGVFQNVVLAFHESDSDLHQ